MGVCKRSRYCSREYTRTKHENARDGLAKPLPLQGSDLSTMTCSKSQQYSHRRFWCDSGLSHPNASAARCDAAHSATSALPTSYRVTTHNSFTTSAHIRTSSHPRWCETPAVLPNAAQTRINTTRIKSRHSVGTSTKIQRAALHRSDLDCALSAYPHVNNEVRENSITERRQRRRTRRSALNFWLRIVQGVTYAIACFRQLHARSQTLTHPVCTLRPY